MRATAEPVTRRSLSRRPLWPLALIALAGGWPTAHALGQSGQVSAKVRLKRLLANQRSVDSVRFEHRVDPSGAEWLLKVQVAKKKGVMVTVINPISRSGVVSIDDGKLFQIYSRDDELLRVQSSPVLMQPSVEWRMKLIEQNYRIKFGDADNIGGRAVQAIEMVPVHPPVPARTFYFESDHDTVLRYVVTPEDDEEFVVFETKSVTFGREAAERGFTLPPSSEDARIVKEPTPKKLAKAADARPQVGFTPRIPASLPFGFKVTGTYLYGQDARPFVDVKLSDGMASLTVRQWKPNDESRRPMAPRNAPQDEDRYGVWYAVTEGTTDHLPDQVLESVLQAFLRVGG